MRESPILELKREPSKTFLKTVSAFANYGTGRVVFGVGDNGEAVSLDDPEDSALRVENAINDALVHRCWDVRANIKASMFADRIESTSPGGLPQGITQEEYISGGPSVSRNPILANLFFRLGYIERFDTGIARIIQEYAGLTASPHFDVRDASITVVLPVDGSVGISSDEAAVLKALPKGTSQTRAKISNATGMSRDKTIRLLGNLVAPRDAERVRPHSGGKRILRCCHIALLHVFFSTCFALHVIWPL